MPDDVRRAYKGPETLAEFLETYGAKFQTDAEARLGYEMYIKAKHSGLPIHIGRLESIRKLDPGEVEVLLLPDGQWTPAINEVWLQGGMDRGDDALELGFLGANGARWEMTALEEGLDVVHRVVGLHPHLPWPRVRRAGLLAQLNRLQEARADLDCAIALDLGRLGALIAHHLRIRVLRALGSHEDALPDAHRLVELAPDTAGPLIDRAELLLQLGDRAAAQADLDRAIELEPRSAAGYFQRSKLLLQLDRGEEAVQDASRIVELLPGDPGPLLHRAGLLAVRAHLHEARADLDRAITLDNHNPVAFFRRAKVLLSLGLLEPALGDLERAIVLAPRSAELRVERGKVLYRLDRRQQAEEDLKLAAELQPDHDEALYALAQIFAMRGESGGARETLARLRAAGHALRREELEKDPAFDRVREQADFRSFVETLDPTG